MVTLIPDQGQMSQNKTMNHMSDAISFTDFILSTKEQPIVVFDDRYDRDYDL